ncbi:GTP 3',8-cyclase MoaA [Aquifex sp.]
MLRDKLGRPLEALRISLTDRCNFRCSFCMPPGRRYNFLPKSDLLSPNEIEEIVKVFAKLGVKKVRLTGGEPTLREDLEEIVDRIRRIEGIQDIALTTNGYLLEDRLKALKEVGLKRITFSVHSLNPEVNERIVNRKINLFRVLRAIDEAKALGFKVKVNAVIIRGVNEGEILPLAEYFKKRKVVIRFIEFMDVGTLNDWDYEKVVSAEEILRTIREKYEVEELGREEKDTALRYRYTDDGVEFGIIASVTKPFCRGCNRIRLSADGKVYTCLFASEGHDIRSGKSLEEKIREIWINREDRYSELRKILRERKNEKVEMFKVGG